MTIRPFGQSWYGCVDLLKVRMSRADGFLKAVPATGTERKTIGIPLYSNFDSLDVLGPFQTFTMAADRLEPKLLAASNAPVRSSEGVEITPHATFNETKSLDVLFVPGGIKLEDILKAGDPARSFRDTSRCGLTLPTSRVNSSTIATFWHTKIAA